MKDIDFSELKRQSRDIHAPDSLKDKLRERCLNGQVKKSHSFKWKPAVALVCVLALTVSTLVWGGEKNSWNSKELSLIVYAKGEDGEVHETLVGEEGADIYTSANECYGVKQEWVNPKYCGGVYWIDESVSVLDYSFFLQNSNLKTVIYTIKNENVYFAEDFKINELPPRGEDNSIDERYYNKIDGFKNNGARFYTYDELTLENDIDITVYGVIQGSVLKLSYEEQLSRTYKLAVYENQVFSDSNPLQIRVDYTYNDGEKGSLEIRMTENVGKSDGSKRYLNVMNMIINTSN